MRPHRHQRIANKAASLERQALVVSNLATPVPKVIAGVRADGKTQSLGYRLSPSMKQSHQIRIHFTPMGGNSRPDMSLTGKQLSTKYRETGPYKETTRVPSTSLEVKVRVGTTPARTVMMKDKETGEERPVKVRAKAKWGPVGSKPKDAGIDW